MGRDRQRPRIPGVLYSLLALMLLSMIGMMTIAVSQPPPPTIAEFAPQAMEQIQDAPEEQTSEFGTGDGDEVSGEAMLPLTPVVAEQPEPVEVPRVRRCVGEPPRQIEDPQAPPCVPYWEGDNGGSTYKGVTRNEVIISVPFYDAYQEEGFHKLLEVFFNSRFEFYGRRVTLIPMDNPATNPEEERAAATAVDEELGAFASTRASGGSYFYYLELARRGIVSSAMFSQGLTTKMAEDLRPYHWSYLMVNDIQFTELGRWACAKLVGRDAAHSGDALMAGQERVFGVYFQRVHVDAPIRADPFVEELERCGASVPVVNEVVSSEEAGGGAGATAPTNAVLQMREAGVTTVVCLCIYFQLGHMFRAASAQGYQPEWIVSTYEFNDDATALRVLGNHSPDQLANTFGISFRPKHVTVTNAPVYWAVREMDPNHSITSSPLMFAYAITLYTELMPLMSGIQMAGPNLTPHTFERGLHRTVFPNPDHPIMAGHVGFDGDHGMTVDAAEIWWSNTARSPYGDQVAGAFCYVGGGARHRAGTWTAEERFFEQPCDSGV